MQCSQYYYKFILHLQHQFPLNFISPALQLIFLHCPLIGIRKVVVLKPLSAEKRDV